MFKSWFYDPLFSGIFITEMYELRSA